ncbi:MAG TPA: GNAT family N-acetyltransferase [Ferrovibrio sp.]|jgi:RimJ/RimL family protein N-acetyltransferase|uniref:GNAT family N-acetyltransferase n=1 Tax=Ferrovibrio sp. TaxID=1917215 RepID=UPI002B4AC05F|nr:GNAT family N-acetyltransferase [Ferrovibrio sp.]HLT76986.1 GNAT family N-acetyltransferase [Ferrovibrio sp.]
MAQQIETDRLRLRRFAAEDWEVLARFYSDDTVMRHMLPGKGLSRREAQERAKSNIHNFNDHWARRNYGVWAVEDRRSGRLLGQCGLRWIPEAEQTELLYLFSKTVWGRGLATEAGRAALDFAFTRTDLNHLIAVTAPQNSASQRVLSKLGFTATGEAPLWERIVSWFELSRERWATSSG